MPGKCIAAWHDAAAIALDADPGAFIISGPLEVTAVKAMLSYLSLSHPLRCPVTSYQNDDIANLILAPPAFRPVPPSSRATAFGRQPKRTGDPSHR